MIENINWYPGHMKKTGELIAENLKIVDTVIEVVDARIPCSSRNPVINSLTAGKPRIIALNKSDLADDTENKKWIKALSSSDLSAVRTDCLSGDGIKAMLSELDKKAAEKKRKKGDGRPLRMMIAGVPNVGKSSLINRLTGRKSTKVGNKPGVTRGKQWLTMKNGMQILDTPGILWPKFEDREVGLHLAFCGSIRDEIMDSGELALELLKYLGKNYGDLLAARYKLEHVPEDALELMEDIAVKRGFVMSGGFPDYERTARTVIDEFRRGMIGRITLEKAGEYAEKI